MIWDILMFRRKNCWLIRVKRITHYMRYIIGIDLGTTNCAMAFVDAEQSHFPLQLFAVPQLTAQGKSDSLPSLPSFCYLAGLNEFPPNTVKLPWKNDSSIIVGQFAKKHGARVPTRLVQSAKSWLCNVAANRADKILPVEAADPSQRLSPVEASTKYLEHLRDAWNAFMAKGDPDLELEEQEVILTVPASFDESARALTVEAAHKAGFRRITLVEEPQAAFYSWISNHEKEWQSKFKEGDFILVCDTGGGTTDFSLIEVVLQSGKLAFQRMAVGDHLLLGGDNMDAALAFYLEQKLLKEGHPTLESNQWLQLQSEARSAKEALLEAGVPANNIYTVVLHGTGSSVVKGSISTSLTRTEAEQLLLQGFFGVYSLEEALKLRRSRGFRTMGLPYEDEPSITKHLAYFLQQSQVIEKKKGIDFLLFNGGTFKPEIFQDAVQASLEAWFPKTPVNRLKSVSLDLAVARGAAYYGKARRGIGVAIGGGLPRTYYLKIDVIDSSSNLGSKALTLLPRGSEEEKTFQSEKIFSLRPNSPVSFTLLTSHVRLHDKEGELIDIDPLELQPLPPILTLLRFQKKKMLETAEMTIPVKLGIKLTPIGTVEMWLDSCNSEHRWQLEFQLKSAEGDDVSIETASEKTTNDTFEKGYLDEAKEAIGSLFLTGSTLKPSRIMEKLETLIGMPKSDWGPMILRELWAALLKSAPNRKISIEHEARWWNLAGYFLRPGYGFPLDDFRMKELWKIILAEIKTAKASECQIQMWICYRRIAGGLNKGQQMQLAVELAGSTVERKSGKFDKRHNGNQYEYSEKIRALAAMERIDVPLKIKLGEALVDRLLHHSVESYDIWSLGRIGARHLLYGSVGQVIPKEYVGKWVEMLLQHLPLQKQNELMLCLMRQLARKTDQRELNLSDATIAKITNVYTDESLKDLLLNEKTLTQSEKELIYGDRLPAGLVLELARE